MGGLKNRFPPEVFQFWVGWYTDIISGKNNADCLHHILSPSSNQFVAGIYNTSILNSCPLNNFETHLYNPDLHKPKVEAKLLQTILKILLREDYQLTAKDVKFYQTYEASYLLEI